MHFASLLTLGLAQLGPLAAASPVRTTTTTTHLHALSALSYLPDTILWHATDAAAINNTPTAFPTTGGNVTACGGVVAYDAVSHARTSIVRADCADLAAQVRATPGFWELYRWARNPPRGRFAPLVSNGTCEFAVKRRDTPIGLQSNTSDVVIIGNRDVYSILNASVYDFAAAADEPFVDSQRKQGHVNCRWWFAVNASIEFRIQKTGTK